MNEFGLSLLWLMGQISVLCFVAMPVYLLARRGHPRTGALATLATLLLITAVSVAALSPWPRWSISDSTHRDGITRTAASSPTAAQLIDDATQSPAFEDAATASVDATTAALLIQAAGDLWQQIGRRPVTTSSSEGTATFERTSTLTWTGWLAWLFVVGLVVSLLRLLLGLLAVARHRRNSEAITDAEILSEVDALRAEFGYRSDIDVRRSETIASAATVGWKHPLILLPPEHVDWSASERRGVLAHEIAHICSHDFLCWACAQAGLLLHFYHPLVHWLARRLRLEQELAADAAAARCSGGAEPYLQTLAALALRQADRPVAWPARTFLPVKGTLIRRVEMLRESRVARAVPSLWRHGTVITLLLTASLVLCGIKPPESKQALADDSPQASAPPTVANDAETKAPLTTSVAVSEEATVLTKSVVGIEERAEAIEVAQAGDRKARRERRRERKAAEAAPSGETQPFDLSFVPTSTNLMLGIRPASIASEKSIAPLIGGLEQTLLSSPNGAGLRIADLRQVLMLGYPAKDGGRPLGDRPVFVITPEADAGERVRAWVKSQFKTEIVFRERQPVQLQESHSIEVIAATILGADGDVTTPRAIAIGRDAMVRELVMAVSQGDTTPDWLDEFTPVSRNQMAIVARLSALRAEIDAGFNRPNAPPNPAIAFAPLWQQTDLLAGGSSIGPSGKVEVIAHCRGEAGARQVAATAQSLIPLGQNMLAGIERQMAGNAAGGMNPQAIQQTIGIARDFLGSIQVRADGSTVELTAEGETSNVPVAVALLMPALQSARSAARRSQSTNNLKQIALALHNYHDTYGHFPAPAVLGPDGKTTHSWRVAILPYVEAHDLYKQYRQDEPWDSENNLKVLKQMPAVFRHPNEPDGSTTSCYFGLTGPHTAFGNGNEGTKLRDIIDGTSNTLMVVEARRDIPWTKPDDIPYDAEQPVPKFGGFNPGVWVGVLVDGAALTFAEAIEEQTVRAMISRDGGEPVSVTSQQFP